MTLVDYAAEAARNERESRRLYRQARKALDYAAKSDRAAAGWETHAAWLRGRPDIEDADPESFERAAAVARRSAASDRERAPRYRAWAREAAARARSYTAMAAGLEG